MIEVYNFISNWQRENDSDFKRLPIDNLSNLIFDDGNCILTFIFSSESKRNECNRCLPIEITDEFRYTVNQEEGITHYKVKL